MPQGPSAWFDARVYLSVVAALLLIIVYYNPYIAVLGAIVLFVLYKYGRERSLVRQRELAQYLEAMACNRDVAVQYALQNLPVAIALVDEEGIINWSNSVFNAWSPQPAKQGQPIFAAWPDLVPHYIWGKSGTNVIHGANDRYYQVLYRPVEPQGKDDKRYMLIYIMDITASERVKAQCYGARPVVGLVQVDNFDELMQGVDEATRSAITAAVGGLLLDWAASRGGLLKKYAEDRYVIFMTRQALDSLVADKFDILDKVRAIKAGNKIPVTLSISLAAGEEEPGELGRRAEQGLDLALGRGGDQAAVNIGGNLEFYGGKAKAVEKHTRVKARVVAHAIREALTEATNVLVMGHGGEDFDSLGAALGIVKMARVVGKDVHVIVSQPGNALSKLQELLLEYREYAGVFIDAAAAERYLQPGTLLFVLDTHRPSLTAAPALLSRVEKVVVIDHHRRSEEFVTNPLLVYLEPSASSTSELVTELLQYFTDSLDLTRLEATALYAGIIVDTKNFAVQTGVRTFEAASYLRRAGADPSLVRRLFRVDFASLVQRAEVLRHTELLPGGVALAVYPRRDTNAQVIAAQTADALMNAEGVRVSFVLWPWEDGVAVSARSNGEVNVQALLEELGGGGHQTVAGAQIRQTTVQEVRQRILALVQEHLKE